MSEEEVPVRDAPLEFRERVSDSILGRREWVYLSEEEKRRAYEIGRKVLPAAGLSALEVKRHRLSFYENATLLELSGGDLGAGAALSGRGPLYYLEDRDALHPLSGGSAYVIPQEYDPDLKLNLTRENALDYLRFYFFFVHKKNGPVFILDDLRHPALDLDRLDGFRALELEEEVSPPAVKDGGAFWDFTFDVFFLYGAAIFKTTFTIDNGIVDETEDVPVAEGLPVVRLKGDYSIRQE